jgi:hypothetical protein
VSSEQYYSDLYISTILFTTQNDCSLLTVCHIPNDMIVESFLRPISSTSSNKPHGECWSAINKSKIFPITALPVNLCTAWNASLNHLQRALFLSHTEADKLRDADYYDDIIRSREVVSATKIVQKTVADLDAVHDENSGDNIDGIEYFPQPPDKRPVPETVNNPTSEVSRAEQVFSKKAVSRPGRKYA